MNIHTDISKPTAHPVIFGCDTGSLEERSTPSFRGMIDESAIYAGALSQSAIIGLMQRGTGEMK